eukprot:m.1993 g.1993  ORF g.1993 m.1993 type:complete len:307 (+) comp1686_c0_seq1:111-1031(+)
MMTDGETTKVATCLLLESGQEEIDRQMSPSKWSHRYDATKVIEEHCRILKEETTKSKEMYTCVREQYGTEKEVMDSYALNKDALRNNKALHFVYIHGGMWQALGIDDSGFMVGPLVEHNVVVHSLEYSIAPEGSMSVIVDQCARAIAYVLNNFEGKVVVCGHSAGGHLAVQMQFVDWTKYKVNDIRDVEQRIVGILSVSGLFDLSPVKASYANEGLKLTEEEVTKYSPLLLVQQVHSHPLLHCKLVLAIAEHDPDEFRRHTIDYKSILTQEDVDVIDLNGEDHFSAIEHLRNADYVLTELIVKTWC